MDVEMLLWQWPIGGIAAIEETRRKFNDLHIFIKARRERVKMRGRGLQNSQSIKEIQAIFLEQSRFLKTLTCNPLCQIP